ncbi:glutathione S-transferase family protein [Sandaracinobacter sp. RS1-74]|uniref:glutathione S-transferase family protein n=1 Tax=Sandaracinobacteroides sayramensis TaxID=2913411 RepID=UPI001ED9D710|nr:glutathione S-transferase family protein [Sandaracinobacteroides sayramensis]MCG2841414.1 glutathione S-transferase family protein [Sandaracinobacteroides sayramensis]
MSGIIFYTHPQSRGQTVRWMLEELGQPYEQVLLEYGTTMKSPDYLATNPMGKVPAIRHRGRVVTEAAAICAYLADAFPEAGLAPALPDRAAYYRWLFFAAGPMESAMLDHYRKIVPEDEQKAMVGYGSWEDVLRAMDLAVSENSWMASEAFSAADVYAGSSIDWPARFGMYEPTENMARYLERIRARPAYGRAKAIDAELVEKVKAGG